MKLSRTRVTAVILLLVLAVAEAAAVDYTTPGDQTTTSPTTPHKEPKDSDVSSKEPKEPKDKEPKSLKTRSPKIRNPKSLKIRSPKSLKRRGFTCPAACADTCQVDCVTCSPVCDCNKPGAVCQDPRFVGADGITFYFHGKKDQDFCLVSDSNLHINAHFIGKRTATMGRDFTWVQALGLLFNNHKIYLGAQKTATWNDAIDRISLSFDGQPIDLPEEEGASWQSPAGDVSITRARATNAVVIEAEGNFKIKAVVVPITEKDSLIHKYGVTQEDCLAHLDLSFKFKSLSRQVNGVLGQTYASNYVSRVKMGVAMPVLGGEKEFHSSSIFATDCAVARFNGSGIESSEESIEFADLNCASGFSGRGVVCKR
uniref:Root cap n=1 Tax=Chenopodium quinoa TaxID=63459 RepID=A0A803N282_CHEQI